MPGDLSVAFFAKFIYNQLFGSLPVPTASFAGKTVIVTGANTGLGLSFVSCSRRSGTNLILCSGLEAARHINMLGASKIIIACRSTEKGETAKKSIVESNKCDPSAIEVWPLDLSSYASVKAFAARATKDLPRLDVLLENAGVAMTRWDWAEDNELNLTVNVVSTFLLAFLLFPKLKETATKFNTRPNLSIVTSDTHATVDFNERNAPEGIFNHMNDKNSSSNFDERYQISKLLEVYVVREMAARKSVDSYPLTVNMLNPGLCKSELAREGSIVIRVMRFLLGRTAEQGSRMLVHAASAGPETHGEYLDMCKVAPTASVTKGPEGEKTQKKVWEELMAKLEKIEPGVSGNL